MAPTNIPKNNHHPEKTMKINNISGVTTVEAMATAVLATSVVSLVAIVVSSLEILEYVNNCEINLDTRFAASYCLRR